jgi:hypothetical protein
VFVWPVVAWGGPCLACRWGGPCLSLGGLAFPAHRCVSGYRWDAHTLAPHVPHLKNAPNLQPLWAHPDGFLLVVTPRPHWFFMWNDSISRTLTCFRPMIMLYKSTSISFERSSSETEFAPVQLTPMCKVCFRFSLTFRAMASVAAPRALWISSEHEPTPQFCSDMTILHFGHDGSTISWGFSHPWVPYL